MVLLYNFLKKGNVLSFCFFMLILVAAVLPFGKIYAFNEEVYVPEKYTNVVAGERFYFEVDIKYPENPSRKDLRLEYDIYKDDKLIAQSQFLKAVETQASFMDFIVIPENASPGMYVIKAKISDYADLKKESSATFYVTAGDNSSKLYLIVIIGSIISLALFIAWEFHRMSKVMLSQHQQA